MKNKKVFTASDICFGLDRATDEHSLLIFLQKFADGALLSRLIPRLTDSEIQAMVEELTALLRKYLHDKEYHQLFLQDRNPPADENDRNLA